MSWKNHAWLLNQIRASRKIVRLSHGRVSLVFAKTALNPAIRTGNNHEPFSRQVVEHREQNGKRHWD
jgi:hypothetical protein